MELVSVQLEKDLSANIYFTDNAMPYYVEFLNQGQLDHTESYQTLDEANTQGRNWAISWRNF